MKVACPHCAQNLELDPETLAALQGQPHFACPSCEGLMAVPQVQPVATSVGQPVQSSTQPEPKKTTRNRLILAGIGVIAVITAGLFFFLTEGTTSQPALAKKNRPYLNTLGMKFVPVPGTKVLFCIHETRYQDYAAFASSAAGVHGAWKNQTIDGFTLTDQPEKHPVVNVCWEDAQAFCAWLSKQEGKTYRLPTDQEWSHAVGIRHEEKWQPGTTPATVFQNKTDFLWGTQWPPPPGSGNYSDESRHAKAPGANRAYLKGYDDGFPTTAPVMSFAPSKLGLYDMSGNVWEWCEDWHSHTKRDRVLRGGSRYDWEYGWLLMSCRDRKPPGRRDNFNGFRCVIEIVGKPTPEPDAPNP